MESCKRLIYHENQIFVKLNQQFPLTQSLIPSQSVSDFFESFRTSFQVSQIQSTFWFSKSSLNRIIRVKLSPNQKTLLIEKMNSSRKDNLPGAEFLDLTTNKSDKGKKVIIFLVDSDIVISDFKNDKNLRNLC